MTSIRHYIDIVEGAGRESVMERVDTNSPAFKAWFGDSKVVDGAGRPLRVYHGTTSDFAEFDIERSKEGFFFAEQPSDAAEFARQDGGNIKPVYLSIQNPASFDQWRAAVRASNSHDAIGLLQRNGFDGAAWTDAEPRVWLAFNSRQIRSAISDDSAGRETVLREGRDAALYHGTSYKNAVSILAANTIEARTSQFLNGHKARSVKGVSLSRNWRMAGGWGPVMFELSQPLLIRHHRVVPVNYGQKIAARSTEYAEAEEFVVGPITDLDSCLLAVYVTRVPGRFNRDLVDALARHPKSVLVDPPGQRLGTG